MLANTSYRDLDSLGDTTERLNLAWAADEREFLDVDLNAVLREALAAESAGLGETNRYLVRDPYGHAALAAAFRAWSGRSGPVPDITVGAGVSSLLHALAPLARRGCRVVGDVYPDLPHWARQAGCAVSGGHGSHDEELVAVRTGRPGVVLLDRPSATGSPFDDLDSLTELAAATHPGLVVVDESNANYELPEFSAVGLVGRVPNLVVLRGLSKGYGLGALRIGVCVSAEAATHAVREVVPPMQSASLSLHLTRLVMELGDVATGLRARIAEVRRLIAEVSPTLAGLAPTSGGPVRGSRLTTPYLLFEDNRTPEICGRLGMMGKRQLFWSGCADATVTRFRLALPLRPERTRRLLAALVSPADPRRP